MMERLASCVALYLETGPMFVVLDALDEGEGEVVAAVLGAQSSCPRLVLSILVVRIPPTH